MKRNIKLLATLLTLVAVIFLLTSTDANAQSAKGGKGTKGFVDLNGDGINDNAIDSDGDGIPNGKDPDFVKPQDGTGRKLMNGKSAKNGKGGYGPGDGTGKSGIGPRDGTGYGPGTKSGNCDGTGPKGSVKQTRRGK